MKKKIKIEELKDFKVKLSIERKHPSGIGCVPGRSREVEISEKLARELYKANLIDWDLTNNIYVCWDYQFKQEWLNPRIIKLGAN